MTSAALTLDDLEFARRHASDWFDRSAFDWGIVERDEFCDAVVAETEANGSLDLHLPSFHRVWIGSRS